MKQQILFILLLIIAILTRCIKEEPCINCDPPSYRTIDYEPAWSPDGKWIAFYHGTPGESGIYLISPDGDKIKKWHGGTPQTPEWSPDSEWITFSENGQIWKKKLDGDSLTQLTFEGRNFFPTWSPNGKWIVFDGWVPNDKKFYGIFKIDYKGEEKALIKYDENEGDIRMPSWSDDSTIFYVRYSPKFYSTEIFSMDSNGENEIRLTFNNSTDYYPKISRDRVAFLSKPQNKAVLLIWKMNADGSNLKQMTSTQAYSCDWSPDGDFMVFTDARSENGRLWIMNEDGSDKRQLTFEQHFVNF